MDNRLDFYNDVNKYLETITEEDTFLLISFNKKEGDLMLKFVGEWEYISNVVSNPEAVNHTTDSVDEFEDIKKLFLNTAANICKEDNDTLNKMIDGLNKIKTK